MRLLNHLNLEQKIGLKQVTILNYNIKFKFM